MSVKRTGCQLSVVRCQLSVADAFATDHDSTEFVEVGPRTTNRGDGSSQGRPRAFHCRLPTTRLSSSKSAHCRLGARRGFTLTEILVVIGIIVLILAMAVPAFNFITGARSLEAAQNSVSAMLARARSQAIFTGEPVGVAIYDDAKTRRYTMALVQFDATPPGTTNIDLAPDQDPQPLQPETAARGMVAQGNYATPAVVMFDAQGRLVNVAYTLNGTLAAAYHTPTTPPPVTNGFSQLALILYERTAYDNNIGSDPNWLNTNGLMLVINRYNGTLLGTE